jgi:hypothetical protein
MFKKGIYLTFIAERKVFRIQFTEDDGYIAQFQSSN